MPKRPILTVDIIIRKNEGYVFIRRKNDPYKGWWALPGGIVEYGETLEHAAVREAKEETGLDVILKKLVGIYSAPNRDPRGHYVTVAYLADAVSGEIRPSCDAEDVRVFSVKPEKTAFDHDEIFDDTLNLH